MSLNDIVVYVDSAEAAKARAEFAVALAKTHGAHLIGVAFAPTTLLPLYGADVGFADMTEVLESVKTQGANALDAFKARAVLLRHAPLFGKSMDDLQDFLAVERLFENIRPVGGPELGEHR